MTAAVVAPASFAEEGGHWYTTDGTPMYEIVGKNGVLRNTTLRDARTLNLLPSTTGIIRMAAAPALEKWKRKQMMMACLTLPREPDESEESWLSRVETDWQAEGKAAAARGTLIHGAVECAVRGDAVALEFVPHVAEALRVLAIATGLPAIAWSAERSFGHQLGYGGKTDLHTSLPAGGWVVDVKTKDADTLADLPTKLYDDHVMQLASYRRGVNVPGARCGILFVGRGVPLASFVEAGADALAQGTAMFDALLSFWQAKNKYRPTFQ